MKKITIIQGIIAMFLIMLFGCSDDFLERPGQGNLDGNILANQQGVEGLLIAAYAYLDGYSTVGGAASTTSNFIMGSITSDDAYKGSGPGDMAQAADIELYQWSTSVAASGMNEKWASHYDAINRVNATLLLLSQVEGVSEQDHNRIKGEAFALRAFYHFELYKVFKNIPYYKEDDTEFRKSNVGVDALSLIIEDLQNAIDILPETQNEVGRITQWTAKAMLGKVQVWQEDWSAALVTLRDVDSNGPYALEENFHYVFEATHDNGPETVLAFQASVDDGTSSGQNGNWMERGLFPYSGSPFGGYGFHQPSQNLVNVFKVDADGLPFLDGSWNSENLDSTDAVDPRLDWTVGRDNVPYMDWGLHEPSWIRARAWAGPYSPKKNVYEQASEAHSHVGRSPMLLHSMNNHLVRYADILLLLAEAEIHAGSLDEARLLINQIRTRSAAGVQGPLEGPVVVPIDDPRITWANYKIGTYPETGWDASKAMAALKMERRLELGMEGHRFFDLRRWGDAITVLNDYLAVESTRRAYLTGAFPFQERHMLYPIPVKQVMLSVVDGEQRLVQNPGW